MSAGRVRTPTLLQMEAAECGAAALGIVLGYHGRFVPLEQLRVACGVSRDGSKAGNVLKGARQFGLEGKGYRKEDPRALRALPLPFIVFWNFNHFLVVEGFAPDGVFLNDPASGPRTVSHDEFDQSFTGVVLVFRKTEAFQRGGRPDSFRESVARRLPGSRLAVAYLVLATLGLVLPNLLVPVFARVLVDGVLVGGLAAWVRPLLVAMAATALLRAGFTALQQATLTRVESKLALSGSAQFFWHVLRLPGDFFAQRFAGEVASRVAVNDRVAFLLSGELATSLVSLLLLGFYLALMLQYDAALTLATLAVAAVNLAVLRLLWRRQLDDSRLLLMERGKLQGVSTSGLELIETLKATGRESDFFARWAGHQAKATNAEQDLGARAQVLGVTPALLGAANAALVLSVGSLRVIDGVLTMGMLVTFQALVAGFLEPVHRLLALGGRLQEAQGDLARLDDVLRHPRDPMLEAAAPEAAVAARLEGLLEIRDLTFGYSRLEPPLLSGLSLTVRPGQRVALVGRSGSGKSTVAKIVSGLYQPWSGEVRLDGRPRALWPRTVVTGSLGVVDQDICLFDASVRENLTLWDATVDERDVVQAARDACIHAEISARPGGYEARVEEGGRNFSGGQRQRLEIARALVNRPRLVVLDEATSALDPVTEQQIDDNLRRRGCACLIVAHRLSTIRDADEIVVLERGRVVERGRHEELMRADGAYRRLVAAE